MPNGLYFTTGQAAHQLATSQAQIRALCLAGAVESESTPGGQFRIPAGELERLKRAGLPQMPRPLPQEGAPGGRNGRARHCHPELLADPSEEVVSAAEDVVVTENLLRKRKIELDLAEVDDQFQARQIAQAERKAERDRAERARLEEEARTDWLRLAEEFAVRRVHPEVPAQMRLAALEALRARLEPLTPIPSPQVTVEIIDATLELVLGEWIRLGDMASVSVELRKKLPWEIRNSPEASRWETAAQNAAVAAMIELLADNLHAGVAELRGAAARAVEDVVRAFRHELRCERLLDDRWWLRLPDGTAEEHAQAKAAVAAALRELPATASGIANMEKARDAALAPFHAAVAQARAEQQARAEAEARRVRERNYRNSLMQPNWLLLSNLSSAEYEQACAAIREALEALPEGTLYSDLNAARDSAVKSFLSF